MSDKNLAGSLFRERHYPEQPVLDLACVCGSVCVCVCVCVCEGMNAPALVFMRYKQYCFLLLSVTFRCCTGHVGDNLHLKMQKYVKYFSVLSTATIVQSFYYSIHISNH